MRILAVSLLLMLCCGSSLLATTIVPFSHLGLMAEACDAVVVVQVVDDQPVRKDEVDWLAYQVAVKRVIKGKLSTTQAITIQRMSWVSDGWERNITGDLVLEKGETYLLFLSQKEKGIFVPKLLSYGTFQQKERMGQQLWVPVEASLSMALFVSEDRSNPEPLHVYDQLGLEELLQGHLYQQKSWSTKAIATSYAPRSFYAASVRTTPGLCDSISGSRWLNFPATALPVNFPSVGDTGCATANACVNNAINAMNGSYIGINLGNNGAFSGYVPNCSGGSAYTGNFLSWVNANLGGSRNIIVQYNDPCEEIDDMTNCSGILAIGGAYSSGTHVYDGQNFSNSAYGFVVTNDSFGTCYCNAGITYEIVMTHELTHTLGLGHIAPDSGIANMNPSCCNSISALDITCVDYLYTPSGLPVDLLRFTGKRNKQAIDLQWLTDIEYDNDYFTLERSADGQHFEHLEHVLSLGNAQQVQAYHYQDKNPLTGPNYYRLSQTDINGTVNQLKTVVVDYYQGLEFQLSPNPTNKPEIEVSIQSPDRMPVQLEVLDLLGRTLVSQSMELQGQTSRTTVSLDQLSNGIYYLIATQGTQQQTQRFIKM